MVHFSEQDRLLFARVDIGVTEFPTKTPEKEEQKILGLSFFFKSSSACASLEIFIFLAAEKRTFGWGA